MIVSESSKGDKDNYKIRINSKSKIFDQIKIKKFNNIKQTEAFFLALSNLVSQNAALTKIKTQTFHFNASSVSLENKNFDIETMRTDLKSHTVIYDSINKPEVYKVDQSNQVSVINTLTDKSRTAINEISNKLRNIKFTDYEMRDIYKIEVSDCKVKELLDYSLSNYNNHDKMKNLSNKLNENELTNFKATLNNNEITYNNFLFYIQIIACLVCFYYNISTSSYTLSLISISPLFYILSRKRNKSIIINNEAERLINNIESNSLIRSYSIINLNIENSRNLIISYFSKESFNLFSREFYYDDNKSLIFDTLPNGEMLRFIIIEKINTEASQISFYLNIESLKNYAKKINTDLFEYLYFSYSFIKLTGNNTNDLFFLSTKNIEEESKINPKKKVSELITDNNLLIENNEKKQEKTEEKQDRIEAQKNEIKEEAKAVLMVEESKKPEKEMNEEAKYYFNIYLAGKTNFDNNYLNKPWKSYVDDKKSGLVGYYFDDEKDRRAIKACININKPIDQVFSFCKSLDNKAKYDSNYEKGVKLKTITENLETTHVQYKGKIAFSPRDFITIVYSECKQDFAEIFACSYPTDESTHVKKVVRGNVLFNYFKLFKVSEQSTNVEFYVLSETGLSQYLVNLVLKDLIYTLKELKILLEKNK